MPVTKDKVLSAIELKFKGSSLTKNFKESIAAKMAEKIEMDEEIDAYIEDRADFFIEAQSEGDRRVSSVAKPPKVEEAKKAEAKVDDAEMPSYMKTLMSNIETLTSEVTTLKSQKVQESIADRFAKDERLKDINPVFFKGRIPTTEDDFESAVTEIANDFRTFADASKLNVLGKDNPAGQSAGGGKGRGKLASQAELDEVYSKINP